MFTCFPSMENKTFKKKSDVYTVFAEIIYYVRQQCLSITLKVKMEFIKYDRLRN